MQNFSGGANNLIFAVRLPLGTEAEYAEPREAVLRIYTNLSRDYELPEGIVAALLAERLVLLSFFLHLA